MTTSTPTRRPLPALIFLIALTLLTALVWWRVLHRNDSSAASKPSCKPTSTTATVPRPATVTVAVYNGTTRTGLAKTTSAALVKLGFDSTVGGNAPKIPVKGLAQIAYIAADKQDALALSYYVPGATLVPVTSATTDGVVLTLGTSYKKLATAAEAKVAMTAARVTVAPSTPAGSLPSTTC